MKYASIRSVNGGWIVETNSGEFVFTSFQKAIAAIKEAVADEKE